MSQLTLDKSSERANPSPPFSYVGIDLAGPIYYKETDQLAKCYICFSTTVILMGISTALDAEECLKIIRRFIARRGFLKQIFYDKEQFSLDH